MDEAPTSTPISTRLKRIAEQAKDAPGMVFSNLSHHLNLELLREAYRRTRKGGAVGVDGQTAQDYVDNLEGNLQSLWGRVRSGTYKAPPVRRVHIPKGDKAGETRPIGIPSFEDKVLQRGVAMVMEAIYEQDFYDCSFGFRPGRSAHQALSQLWNGLMDIKGGWVLEVDIRGFFDTIDHHHLRKILGLRVRDHGLGRLVGKWLNAGVLEAGILSFPEAGTPQGGVVSPLLANIYLHEVLDKWFHEVVKPRLQGTAFMVRYADDFVIAFSSANDALRVCDVLPKRFERFGLKLHEGKTRLFPFHMPSKFRRQAVGVDGFDFLGFTHYWGLTRNGSWVVRQKTAKSRLCRALKRISGWCKLNRHTPVPVQHQVLTLKMRGHYSYFGTTGNYRALERFLREVEHLWVKWLRRRSHKADANWKKMSGHLARWRLPKPRITRKAENRRAANP
jgi:RNA-directed DNA polymerase